MNAYDLPAIPYDEWEPTKNTVHLFAQILGKIRLRSVPFRNHWWHVTLFADAHGITTGRMERDGIGFEIRMDFCEHFVEIVRKGGRERLELHDGLSVAEFYGWMMAALERLGIHVKIVAKPYGVTFTSTPFAQDREHASYDADAVERWWRVIAWSSDVFKRYASDFVGKESPVHLFWHSLDLAVARFSGRSAPPRPGMGLVDLEAYSHEVISCGFWAGDPNVRFPAYYTYTAPEPADLTSQPLASGATWTAVPSGSHLGILPYDRVRESSDPAATLLAFMRSGYDAGAATAGWSSDLLRRPVAVT